MTPMIKAEDVDFVKSQAAFHSRMVERFSTDPIRVKRHREYARQFEDLAERLEFSLNSPAPAAPKAAIPGHLRIGELDDLPEELRRQLKISDSDQLEMNVVEVLESFGGEAAIDEILVGLWRKTNEILERDFLARKIYRMAQSGAIYSAKRKGYYQISDPNSEEPFQDEIKPLETKPLPTGVGRIGGM